MSPVRLLRWLMAVTPVLAGVLVLIFGTAGAISVAFGVTLIAIGPAVWMIGWFVRMTFEQRPPAPAQGTPAMPPGRLPATSRASPAAPAGAGPASEESAAADPPAGRERARREGSARPDHPGTAFPHRPRPRRRPPRRRPS